MCVNYDVIPPAGSITGTNWYSKDAACNRTTPHNDRTGLPASRHGPCHGPRPKPRADC